MKRGSGSGRNLGVFVNLNPIHDCRSIRMIFVLKYFNPSGVSLLTYLNCSSLADSGQELHLHSCPLQPFNKNLKKIRGRSGIE
jgi:hypothetical protein